MILCVELLERQGDMATAANEAKMGHSTAIHSLVAAVTVSLLRFKSKAVVS